MRMGGNHPLDIIAHRIKNGINMGLLKWTRINHSHFILTENIGIGAFIRHRPRVWRSDATKTVT